MRLAFIGPMHSGKTTLANAFVENGFRKIAFADIVKDISVSMVNTCLAELERDQTFTRQELDDNKERFRTLLQYVGTDLGREYIGPDTVWIDRLVKKIQQFTLDAPLVCDDCRFINEYEALRSLGFTTVRLMRNESQRMKSISGPWARGIPLHASETEQSKIMADVNLRSLNIQQLREYAEGVIQDPNHLRESEYATV